MAARGPAREVAVLEAVIGLLEEVGFDALTMDAVAARAHASKATIYRRWSGKAQMVVEALQRFAAHADKAVQLPDTGRLEGDLLEGMKGFAQPQPPRQLLLLGGLVQAMQRDPELAATARRDLLHEDPSPLEVLYRRAWARGEADGSALRLGRVALAQEVVDAVTMRRLLFSGQPLEPDFLQTLVLRVVLPLLADVPASEH